MNTLFYAPGACSLGIHVLLEEIGEPFRVERVNLKLPPAERGELTRLNPKSKVPTLVRDDGSVLTEYPAISYWLAATNPKADLLPPGPDSMAHALEVVDYCVSTIHMQGFSRMFGPARFGSNTEEVAARGHEVVTKGYAELNNVLDGLDYALGKYTFADAAVFYVSSWAAKFKIALPAHLAAHFARMQARPAVQQALKTEGLL